MTGYELLELLKGLPPEDLKLEVLQCDSGYFIETARCQVTLVNEIGYELRNADVSACAEGEWRRVLGLDIGGG